MLLFLIPFLTIITFYLVVILTFIHGWESIAEFELKNHESKTVVSVVIALRNEASNIINLLKELNRQSLNKNNYEVILVDDNSEDNSANLIMEYINNIDSFHYYLLPENYFGKKEAIDYGIKKAKGDIIVTTDADCSVPEKWLESYVVYYEENRCKFIVGAVIMDDIGTAFGKFQSLEFLSLISSGAAAIGLNRPILCNAANMAFEKRAYLEFLDSLNKKYISGDDIFLMLKIKSEYKKQIGFLKTNSSVVTIKPELSFTDFLNQRIRWISKSSGYRDFDITFIAVIVFLTNATIVLMLLLSFFKVEFLIFFLSMFSLKTMVDYAFLRKSAKYYNKSSLMKYIIPIQLLYSFYASIFPLLAIFLPVKWKSRIHKRF